MRDRSRMRFASFRTWRLCVVAAMMRAPRAGACVCPGRLGGHCKILQGLRGLSRFSSVRFLSVSCVRGHPAGSPVRCRWRAPFPCSFVVVLIAPRESCSPTYCNASKQKQQQQITPLIPHPWILSHGIPPDKISASAFPENTYQHYLILPLFLIIVCPPTSD